MHNYVYYVAKHVNFADLSEIIIKLERSLSASAKVDILSLSTGEVYATRKGDGLWEINM
jgi:hypothetical protein